MTIFTVVCSRCDGEGRFDRGTCFDCKGTGFRNQKTQPRHVSPFRLTVTFSNGKENNPCVWANKKETAVKIIERQMRVNGWEGAVK